MGAADLFLEKFSMSEGSGFGSFVMVKLSPILMRLIVALASMDTILKGGSLTHDGKSSVSCHNTVVLEYCETVGLWVCCACAYDARLPMPIEGFCVERAMPFTD